jgi:hypothetical protein
MFESTKGLFTNWRSFYIRHSVPHRGEMFESMQGPFANWTRQLVLYATQKNTVTLQNADRYVYNILKISGLIFKKVINLRKHIIYCIAIAVMITRHLRLRVVYMPWWVSVQLCVDYSGDLLCWEPMHFSVIIEFKSINCWQFLWSFLWY